METQPTKIDSLILDEKWNYHMTVSHLTIVKYVNRLTPLIVMTHMDIVINDLDAVKEYQIEQILQKINHSESITILNKTQENKNQI